MSDEGVTRSTASARPFLGLARGVARVLDGADQGQRCAVLGAPIVIGTHTTCDLKLRDQRVSRRHCEVALDPRGFRVRDLDSRNGTRFEGSLLREIFVPPGAILRVGKTHVVHPGSLYGGTSRTAVLVDTDEDRALVVQI